MHMPSGYLNSVLLICSDIIALMGVALALWRVNKKFLRDRETGLQVSVVFIALCGLYFLSAGTKPGMTMHWLGVMMTVMMLGPWLAVLVLSVVHVVFAFGFGIGGIETLGFNIAVCVLVPAFVAGAIHTLSYYYLPRTFPVYVIEIGVGDMLCMVSVDLVLTIVLYLNFDYPSFVIRQDFTLVLALMGGMEAVISTWLGSLLVCFKPSWLVTFNDEEYLWGK
jgi:uncharacterized membrane protein